MTRGQEWQKKCLLNQCPEEQCRQKHWQRVNRPS